MAFAMGRGVIDMHLGTGAMRGELGSMRGMLIKGAAIAGAAAAAALTVAITKSVVVFASFEQAMARVKAITGATASEYKALEDRARDLGRTTQFTASQASQAMGFFAQAGLTVKEMLDAMGPTLNLAAAGQLDMATAASIVAKVMRGMKLEADDLTHVVDVLTKAFTSANTDLIQLGEAMKFAAPVAASIGKEIEEVTAAIMAMSDAGIQGTMAGTTLRNVLMKLANPSKQAAQLLEEYNIQIKTTGGSLKTLPALVDEFGRRLHDLGEADKLGVLGQIFEMRAATGFLQLLGVGGDRLREFERDLAGAGGTAERIAKVQMDTLRGSFLRLTSAAEAGMIVIGEGLAPVLRDLATWATEFVTESGPMLRDFGGLMATAIRSITRDLGYIGSILKFPIDQFADLTEWMGLWEKAQAGVNAELKDEKGILDDMVDALKQTTAATDEATDAVARFQQQTARFMGAEGLWKFIQQGLMGAVTAPVAAPARRGVSFGEALAAKREWGGEIGPGYQRPLTPDTPRWPPHSRWATTAQQVRDEMDASDQPLPAYPVVYGELGPLGDS